MAVRLFLHVGLPRTATTSMQKEIFPSLRTFCYLGKHWDNQLIARENAGLEMLLKRLESADVNRAGFLEYASRQLPSLLSALKYANQCRDKEKARALAIDWARCVDAICKRFPSERFLYSDESLIESVAGLSSHEDHGKGVPLEDIARTGLLAQANVSIVLRDPASFVRASYYKNMEFEYKFEGQPISFDEYIRRQLTLFLRKPSASRIFLAMQKQFVAHLRNYCPNLVVSTFEEITEAPHALDALLGFDTGESPVCLKNLPKENTSFRDGAAVDFMLKAPGIPPGITIDEYAKTFEGTLAHYGLNSVFEESLLPRTNSQKASDD